MKESYTNVIVLDLDGFYILPRLFMLKLNQLCNYSKISIYPTKHGLHIIIYLTSRIHFDRMFRIRHILGDDPKKIIYDKKSKDKNAYKRLFTQKKIINEVIIK